MYVLKPKAKSKSKFLKKQTGLKPSKKTRKTPLYKTVLIKKLVDLYAQIDCSQLTEEFGGTMSYDHKSWVHFQKNIVPIVDDMDALQLKLPAAKDRIQLLNDYDITNQTAEQLKMLLQDLSDKYHSIVREIDVETAIDRVKDTICLLEAPENDPYMCSVATPFILEPLQKLKHMDAVLLDSRQEMITTWQKAEDKIKKALDIEQCRVEAQAVRDTITKDLLPQCDVHPTVGKSLSEAELSRAFFETTLYGPGKIVLSQATAILTRIRLLLVSDDVSRSESTDFIRELSEAVQGYAMELESLMATYTDLHVFHIVFEKLLNWYIKVLRFLPTSMVSLIQNAKQNGDISLRVPPLWISTVRDFLRKHPGPNDENIYKISETPIMYLLSTSLQNKARLLICRIHILKKILTDKIFPVADAISVLSMRQNLIDGTDELVYSGMSMKHNYRKHRERRVHADRYGKSLVQKQIEQKRQKPHNQSSITPVPVARQVKIKSKSLTNLHVVSKENGDRFISLNCSVDKTDDAQIESYQNNELSAEKHSGLPSDGGYNNESTREQPIHARGPSNIDVKGGQSNSAEESYFNRVLILIKDISNSSIPDGDKYTQLTRLLSSLQSQDSGVQQARHFPPSLDDSAPESVTSVAKMTRQHGRDGRPARQRRINRNVSKSVNDLSFLNDIDYTNADESHSSTLSNVLISPYVMNTDTISHQTSAAHTMPEKYSSNKSATLPNRAVQNADVDVNGVSDIYSEWKNSESHLPTHANNATYDKVDYQIFPDSVVSDHSEVSVSNGNVPDQYVNDWMTHRERSVQLEDTDDGFSETVSDTSIRTHWQMLQQENDKRDLRSDLPPYCMSYGDILKHIEEESQLEVEPALRRAEKVLEEEAAVLKQENILDQLIATNSLSDMSRDYFNPDNFIGGGYERVVSSANSDRTHTTISSDMGYQSAANRGNQGTRPGILPEELFHGNTGQVRNNVNDDMVNSVANGVKNDEEAFYY